MKTYAPVGCVGIWVEKKKLFISCPNPYICVQCYQSCNERHEKGSYGSDRDQCRFCQAKSSDDNDRLEINLNAPPYRSCSLLCSCCGKKPLIPDHLHQAMKLYDSGSSSMKHCDHYFCGPCLLTCRFIQTGLTSCCICRRCIIDNNTKPSYVSKKFDIAEWRTCKRNNK